MFNIPIVDLRNRLPTHKSLSYALRDLYEILAIAFHHAAINSGNAFSYADYHVVKNGWPGIGYHFVILPDGTIQWCWDLNVISYHVGDSNRKAIGVCFVGNFDTSKPTPLQIEAAYRLIKELHRIIGRKLEILGHNQYPGYSWKSCPGSQVHMNTFRENYYKWEKDNSMDQDVIKRLERLELAQFGEVYKPKVVLREYEKKRFSNHDGKNGTDVHILKSNIIPELVIGIFGQREYLDELCKSYDARVGINAGYFDMGSKTN